MSTILNRIYLKYEFKSGMEKLINYSKTILLLLLFIIKDSQSALLTVFDSIYYYFSIYACIIII